MAFPVIPTGGDVVSTAQQNTTATRTFPAFSGLTGMQANDLLIAVAIAYQSTATANAVWSGWSNSFTEFVDQSTTTTMAIGAAYKWTTGTETGSLTVTQAATITGFAALILMAITGAHPTTAPTATVIANGTTTAADPVALSPAWGSADTLWIAVAGWGEDSTTGTFSGPTAPPTGFGNTVTVAESGTKSVGNSGGAVAFQQLTAATLDVGTWTGIDTSNARNSALVIAVPPIPTVPDVLMAPYVPYTNPF